MFGRLLPLIPLAALLFVQACGARCTGSKALLVNRYEVNPLDKAPLSWPSTVRAQELYADGGNSGNLVWRYAALSLFEEACLVRSLWEGGSVILDFEADILQTETRSSRVREQWTNETLAFYGESQRHGPSWKWLMHLGSSGAITHTSHAAAEQLKLLGKMDFVTTRGYITTTVLQNDGIDSFPIGCPSMFLNLRKDLGSIIHDKTVTLTNRSPTGIALAISLPPPDGHDAIMLSHYLVNLLQFNSRSRIIAQTLDDFKNAKQYGVPFQRVLFFTTMSTWLASLLTFDAVIGCRIHGSMMGVAAELPTLVIPIDNRVLELVEVMRIPFATVKQVNLSTSFVHLFQDAPINRLLFDLHRRHVARTLRRTYRSYNISLSERFSAFD